MSKKSSSFYITTPIYYVNAKPHIGHAYTSIAADAAARFHRLKEDEVLLLTGTDEHGQKILQAAEQKGISPQEFVDEISLHFKNLWPQLNVEYTDFIRTTEPRHKQTVKDVLTQLHAQGDVYEGEYKGWYCTPCETFWTASQISEGNLCPDCQRPLEEITEKNYFFSLSKYQQWLIDYLKEHPNFIRPQTRYNEVLKFLEQDLEDLCISRPCSRLSWGIALPFSQEHVCYVWFDALINYISALNYGTEHSIMDRFWPADFHLIGKDIIRHHAVFWPIMLKALGLALPKCIFAHGWWMQAGEKISKSKGKVIDPLEIISEYGLDAFRYFLLREVPFGLDGTFSEESFVTRFNSDLANDIGNLLNRTLTMVEKYFDAAIPEPSVQEDLDHMLSDPFSTLIQRVSTHMDQLEFHHALTAIWEFISAANKYIEEAKPWTLSKEGNIKRLSTVIYNLIEALRIICILVWPYMPNAAESIWQQLGFTTALDTQTLTEANTWGQTPVSQKINKLPPLFPRRV